MTRPVTPLPSSPPTLACTHSTPATWPLPTPQTCQVQADLRAIALALSGPWNALPPHLVAVSGRGGVWSNATSSDGPSQPSVAPAVILSLASVPLLISPTGKQVTLS